jgi:hypothetical protein|tara:strand:+ start:1967 stop:2434 length:468 start_codon:yes stop_codon:yes gene_type:complete
MKLEVLRISSGPDSTSGIMFIVDEDERSFVCYTLEDEHRNEKKYGETRIPAGTYKIKLRTEGGYHQKYSKRFPSIHRGMLHITDVPNFEYILIHCGNTDEHTAGCLLVGDSQENNQLVSNGFIGKSTQAYKRIYPKIAEELLNNNEVLITYKDFA